MIHYEGSFESEVIDRLARIEEHSKATKGLVDDHEKRVRALEFRQWALMGVAVMVTPILNKLGLHLPPFGLE